MPSTVNKGYEVQVTGTNTNTWGDVLNEDALEIIDNNLGGITTKTLGATQVDLDADESTTAIVRLIGTLTANVLVTTLAVGFTIVQNATSGAFAVTFSKNGVGSAVTIPQGTTAIIAMDAVNGASLAADNRSEFAAGTRLLSPQAAAPTGWTASATNVNRGIRIAGAGGIQGGSAGFTDIFATRAITGTVGGTAISVAQMPSHQHTGNPLGNNDNDNASPPCASNGGAVGATFSTSFAGGGQSHDHSVTINNLNMNLAYLDVLEIVKS